MSAPAFTMFDVFEEVDEVVYTFADDDALEAWALHGKETYVSVRPARPEDRISDAELQAFLDAART